MTTKQHDKIRVSIDLPESFLEQLEIPEGKNRKTAIESIVQSSRSELIPLDQIDPNPFQPRLGIPFGDVESLADNIYDNGLLQIPQARRTPDGRYQLAFGHRRFKAYQFIYYNRFSDGYTRERHAEFATMPLVIKELSDQKMYEFAASENSNRKDLNPIEVAKSIMKAAELGISQQDAGRLHGYAKSASSELVQLLGLPQEIINLISDDKLTASHGRELRRALAVVVHEPHHVVKMARDAVANELRVIDLKKAVDKFVAERTTPPPMLPLSPSTAMTREQALEQANKMLLAAKAEAEAKKPEPPAPKMIKCPVCEQADFLDLETCICKKCGKVGLDSFVGTRFCRECHHEQGINLKSLKFNNKLQCGQCGAHNLTDAWLTTKPELKPEDKTPAPMPAPTPAEPTEAQKRQRLKDELNAIADTIPLDQLQALINGLKGD